MDPSNLLSGLIGAILGVIGAFGLQAWDRRRRNRGAGRALFFELIQNKSAATMDDSPLSSPGSWSRATWQGVQSDMATFLDPATFGAIAWAYRSIDIAESAASSYGSGSAEHRAVSGVPMDAFERAIGLLGPSVWSGDEIDRLTAKIERPVIR